MEERLESEKSDGGYCDFLFGLNFFFRVLIFIFNVWSVVSKSFIL